MAIDLVSVAAAADALLAQRCKPTLRAVREALGGGSFGTIAPLLKRWDLERHLRAQSALAIPASVRDAQAAALGAVWQAALAAGAEAQREAVGALQSRLGDLQAEHDESYAIIRGLEEDARRAAEGNDALAHEHARLEQERAVLASAHQQLAHTNAELSAQLRLLEERRAAADQERSQLARALEAERARLGEREQALERVLGESRERAVEFSHVRAQALELEHLLSQSRAQASQVSAESMQERHAAQTRARELQGELERTRAELQRHAEVGRAASADATERARALVDALARAQHGERLLAELETLRGTLGERLQAIHAAVSQPPEPGQGTR